MVTTALPTQTLLKPTPPAEKLVTGDELWEMGDIGPSELIDGRIVLMSPTGGTHSLIEFTLARVLGNFTAERGLGMVMGGEVGIYVRRNPDRIRAADVAFVSKQRLPVVPRRYLDVAPELVIEILSPGDRWQDVRQKLEDYFSIGVDQVWIVEPENRTVLAYTSPTTLEKYGDQDVIHGSGPLAGFSLSLAELFG